MSSRENWNERIVSNNYREKLYSVSGEMCHIPTPEQIENGLTDRMWRIRREWVRRLAKQNIHPTLMQLERGLQDSHEVAKEWMGSTTWTPTPEQVEKGLTSSKDDIRIIWANRGDIELSSSQIERGLTDSSAQVRRAFLGKSSSTKQEDIDRMLKDPDYRVRRILAERLDWTATQKQAYYGLIDPDSSVRLSWARRTDFTPTRDQITEGLYDRTDIDIQRAWVTRMDWTPTPTHIERGLTDPSHVIRLSWVRRTDWTPTSEQSERGLNDQYHEVRLAWIKRLDWSHTPMQAERGLADIRGEIRQMWMDRIKSFAEQSLDTDVDDDLFMSI